MPEVVPIPAPGVVPVPGVVPAPVPVPVSLPFGIPVLAVPSLVVVPDVLVLGAVLPAELASFAGWLEPPQATLTSPADRTSAPKFSRIICLSLLTSESADGAIAKRWQSGAEAAILLAMPVACQRGACFHPPMRRGRRLRGRTCCDAVAGLCRDLL